MENRAHALAAGVFILLLGLASAAALWWLSQLREDTRDVILVAQRSVTGLNLQAQVRYRGIRVGKVTVIELDRQDRRNILVTARIADGIPITGSTTAQLYMQGVTGLAYVQLDDTGESDRVIGGVPRIPLRPSQFDQLSQTALELATQAQSLMGRVALLLDDENVSRIERTLASLEQASGRLDQGLAQIQPVIAGAREAVSEANLKKLERVLANLDKASAQGEPLVADVRRLVASLEAMTVRLERLSGEAGNELVGNTLPRANQLLQELTQTSRHVRRLVDQLESSPQSLIFGRGRGRPGPGEAGFDAPR